MKQITVAYSRAAGASRPDTEVVIEVLSLVPTGSNRIELDSVAGLKIADLLGDGYGGTEFHLVDGATMFVGCRIVATGLSCIVGYREVARAPG